MKKNSVAHFEIYADDPDKLQDFYTSLLSIGPSSACRRMDYRLIKSVDTDAKGMPTQSGGINGRLLKRPAGYPGNAWVNYAQRRIAGRLGREGTKARRESDQGPIAGARDGMVFDADRSAGQSLRAVAVGLQREVAQTCAARVLKLSGDGLQAIPAMYGAVVPCNTLQGRRATIRGHEAAFRRGDGRCVDRRRHPRRANSARPRARSPNRRRHAAHGSSERDHRRGRRARRPRDHRCVATAR